MFDLTGMTALVTGASGGIGSAVAKALAGQGARLALSGSNQAKLEAFAAELGGDHICVVADLSDKDSVEGLVPAALAGLGKLDILVNNAGITRDNLAMRMKEDEWDAVLDTNLKAVFRLSKAVMRGMMKARQGRIINITSVVGHSGNPGQANYCAAKAGVAGMTRSLARELGSRNITVNCVAPGLIDTDMTRNFDEKQRESLIATIPLARLGLPEDVAAAVGFLASPGAAYITGTTIHVNGGIYLD